MTGNGADKSRWFSRFVASGIHGEVSDATIQGYLRSASQLEEIWQQIDDNVDNLMLQGMTPWDAYAKMGYALAFVRACRTNASSAVSSDTPGGDEERARSGRLSFTHRHRYGGANQ